MLKDALPVALRRHLSDKIEKLILNAVRNCTG